MDDSSASVYPVGRTACCVRWLAVQPLPPAVVTSVVRMKLGERTRTAARRFGRVDRTWRRSSPTSPPSSSRSPEHVLPAGNQRHRRGAAHEPGPQPTVGRRRGGRHSGWLVTTPISSSISTPASVAHAGRTSNGCSLCSASAPAATVVNNCAAALVLILKNLTTAERSEVVISRGELVQIGGGFRIPRDSRSQPRHAPRSRHHEPHDGRRLPTGDHAARTAMLLKVHRGNFYMDGFVESPTVPRNWRRSPRTPACR